MFSEGIAYCAPLKNAYLFARAVGVRRLETSTLPGELDGCEEERRQEGRKEEWWEEGREEEREETCEEVWP